MHYTRFDGLIAATVTPFDDTGELNRDMVGPLVEKLISEKVVGIFVCGSTGEGHSLTSAERKATLESSIAAATGKMRVIAHVGHNCLADAAELAAHAQQVGADAFAATCPSYLKPGSVATLVDCMAKVAQAAPDLPFYYYHIPGLTHVSLDMVEFLERAESQIPNLVGMKYTHPTLHEFQSCSRVSDGRFEMLWGVDQMLVAAWSIGARGAVGSTYNVAAPLYLAVIDAFQRGQLEEATRLLGKAIEMVRLLSRYPYQPALKEMLRLQGVDAGPSRLPFRRLTCQERSELSAGLRQLDLIG